MANINIVPGLNVFTYRGSNPLNFNAIPNFDNNINYVRTPDGKVRGGVVYENFQTYFPGGGALNDWLTNFSSISSYIVFSNATFTITEQGTEATPPQLIRVTSPLALVGIDLNRVSTVRAADYSSQINAAYWHNGSQWLPFRSDFVAQQNSLNILNGANLPDSTRNNFLPGRTYYIVNRTGVANYFLNIPRLLDYLLADNDDFLRTDTDVNLCRD